MRAWNSLRLLLRTLVQRNIVDRELDAELRFHLEEQVAENLVAGMTPAEARRAALIAMGGMTQITEQCREARNVSMAETVWQDLRFGARMLAKDPAFTLVTVATLAVGIGFHKLAFRARHSLMFG